jgi:hypothetical protein
MPEFTPVATVVVLSFAVSVARVGSLLDQTSSAFLTSIESPGEVRVHNLAVSSIWSPRSTTGLGDAMVT